ncbi:MAG: hypothetical protein Q8S13_02580 [Dehalococcoidia bacterium]|nr:hypothetical protein [Dehalococcoidia bacterium]
MTKNQAKLAARRLAVEIIQDWINKNGPMRFGMAFGLADEDAYKIGSALTELRDELDPES